MLARGLYRKDRQEPRIRVSSIKKDMSDAPWRGLQTYHTREEAFDNEIMQKILPRLQGSSASVRDMLCELFRHCAADHTQKNGDTDSEKMRKVLEDDSIVCRYRKSAEKLQMMVRRFEDDGFTSYWL